MGELMSRDNAFSNAVGHNEAGTPSLQEGVEAIKPLFIVSENHAAASSPLYTRLPSKDYFRLLEILPGTDDARLQCRMHVCSMCDNRGAYEALSYTWMTGREPWTGGRNLYMALHRLRREASRRVVWADALCIDQSNPQERSQQVAGMGDILRNAHDVLVWLGEDEDANQVSDPVARASSKAFAGVCSVVSTWAATAAAAKHALRVGRPQYRIQSCGTLSGSDGEGLLAADSPVWAKVLQLYNKRWFSRLWVVQEIALARRATAIWGACEMPWEWIGLAAAIIRTNWNCIVPGWVAQGAHSGYLPTYLPDESVRLVPVGMMNAYFMYRISRLQNYFNTLRFSFGELLTLTRQFKCEDKRDKIFGLLGLPTTDHVNSYITPDYGQSLAGVYRRVAAAIISSTKCLAFLSHVHHTDLHEVRRFSTVVPPDSTLPSWIPQWHHIGPQVLAPLDAHPDFAAGLSRAAQFRAAEQEAVDADRLGVHGVMLEGVSATNDVGPTSGSHTYRGDADVVLARHGHTRHSLQGLAMALAAGKSWYGLPKDRGGMLADFAHCLVAGRLWWALELDAFGVGVPEEGQDEVGRTSDSQNQTGLNDDGTGASSGHGIVTLQDLKDISRGGNGNLFLDAVATACVGRRLFRTASNMRGVGPIDTQPGDKVCVIYGTPVPFIIRRCDEKQGYTLVGECYIDDIMHGEAVDDPGYEETWIDLVSSIS
ncbi:hypothetical protein N657DRAFT_681786 [Parathielavia appendiculata]|uniref:Heterokaryon incompatibility domain-containing protein n=1 Tax=Parathielavia appendiculata TaxID=2587402 RepID=A0AAN6TYV4_9PEZI|nr:hypothetical protein N657DRAFT_681786 [Parathielavia appendiculata]